MVIEQLRSISAEKVLVEVGWQWALAARRDTAHERDGALPLLSTSKAHLHTWAPQHRTDVNIPRRSQQRHQDGWSSELERGWAGWACQPGEGRDSGGSCCNLQWEVVEKMEPNSSLDCIEIGQEAADIRCNIGHTHQILGQNYHPEGGQTQDPGICVIVIPRDKQNMTGQGSRNLIWIWPCSEQKVRWPQGSLPSWIILILWFTPLYQAVVFNNIPNSLEASHPSPSITSM